MRFSVVIPTLDEASQVRGAILSARNALGRDCEVLVVDGGSRDGTRQVASAAGARLLGVSGGRGEQLRAGAAAAAGDVVVLLHADTRLPAAAADAIQEVLADSRIIAGAFRLSFGSEARAAPLALRLLARFITLRSLLFRTATGDQAIFARTEALRRIGGVPRVPLFEDVRLYQKLRRSGRVRLVRAAVTTSGRRWRAHGTARVILLHLLLRLAHGIGVAPDRLARWYAHADAR
ncbi:MAG: TIGR04283 family arsenosugar biosynthesis glycosyltransferase [Longimicrobiales bacterium]